MAQSARMKKRGQINVVIRSDNKDEGDYGYQQMETSPFVQHKEYSDIMKEFDQYVGLDMMKSFVHEMYAWLYLNKIREQRGLKTGKQALHMVFKGNPGTGKTTVARLIAKMLKDMNVLEKGHLLEVDRADLVGEYIGHTAQKTRELVNKAMGGILFVDEAYSLARGGEKDFGKEAIDTLVKIMEDKQHNFVLILAGYPDEMDRFLQLNPGLPSRFPMIVTFPNYSTTELIEMLKSMAAQRDYVIDKDSVSYVNELLVVAKDYEQGRFSNGRFIRNLLEKAVRMQAVRLLHQGDYHKEALTTLVKSDFSKAFKKILLE
ncbi:AAA family ATPase [Salipaludibacillus aurantiacus]|uniref:Stage V sporulation protein K n=1 Tax=Salipaludibacillus aurantiacus TaxID=1601833 RepID=A0A1H9QER2_9BACI|nr:AAA family ATPase [Salipaludibacillus aurantiacus]SER58922.1 stage V sporulation protein K [Salipaludibacillus aurantiacus]